MLFLSWNHPSSVYWIYRIELWAGWIRIGNLAITVLIISCKSTHTPGAHLFDDQLFFLVPFGGLILS